MPGRVLWDKRNIRHLRVTQWDILGELSMEQDGGEKSLGSKKVSSVPLETHFTDRVRKQVSHNGSPSPLLQGLKVQDGAEKIGTGAPGRNLILRGLVLRLLAVSTICQHQGEDVHSQSPSPPPHNLTVPLETTIQAKPDPWLCHGKQKVQDTVSQN